MTAPLIRAARSTDAGTTGAILSAFIDGTDWMPRLHTRAEDIAFAGHMIARGWVSVAETEGAVKGFIARDGEEVNALYVAPAAQGQGIGTALLREAQTHADHLILWTFQANAGAQRFYARHGFTEAERTDGNRNDEKLPDVRMVWIREST